MSDRHEKWVRVEPGTTIPAGQPYRIEYHTGMPYAQEFRNDDDAVKAGGRTQNVWFVDSSWKPPHPCNAPLNIKGEGFNCDKGWGHALPHGNTEAGAIWDGEQPPTDSPEPTSEPPLVLPTEACVIRAKVAGPVPYRVLFGHPNAGEPEGMTFCRDVDGLSYKADEIESFEVLWREGERGKDALVSWEAIDKLREAYPSDPGADMSPVDYFLREVVGDR